MIPINAEVLGTIRLFVSAVATPLVLLGANLNAIRRTFRTLLQPFLFSALATIGGAFVGAKENSYEIPALPQGAVIDTTGAGDLFAAGYLFGRTNGFDVLQAGRLASLAAGEVISHIGARPKINLKELSARL